MKEAHVYIYGEIANHQSDAKGVVSLSSVMQQVAMVPDADKIIVHIHSIGGDVQEGMAIHDFLKNTGKEITTINEGVCYSIATIVFLAGSKRYMAENAKIMIHNPWGGVQGDAEDVEAYSVLLRDAERQIINVYSRNLNKPEHEIRSMMEDEKYMSMDEAVSMGFATNVLEPLRAVAKMRIENEVDYKSIKNQIKEIMANEFKGFKDAFNAFKNVIKGMEKEEEEVKSMETTLSDGMVLYHSGDLAVGVIVYTDAEMTTVAPDGSHELENGMMITTEDGIVTSVSGDEPGVEIEEIMSKLKAAEDENERLKAELSQSVNALSQATAILAKVKTAYVPEGRTINPKFTSAAVKESKVDELARKREAVKAKQAEKAEAAAKRR